MYHRATYFKGYKVSRIVKNLFQTEFFYENTFKDEQIVSHRTRRSYDFKDKYF